VLTHPLCLSIPSVMKTQHLSHLEDVAFKMPSWKQRLSRQQIPNLPVHWSWTVWLPELWERNFWFFY
jgi:hypothetical protein